MLNNMLNQITPFVNFSDLSNSKPLVLGMLLANGHKNCVTMAEPLGISHDVLQKIFNKAPSSIEELKSFLIFLVAKHYNKNEESWLIIDDTVLAKRFSTVLEGLGFVYDTTEQKEIKGYKIVAICWTNQLVTIPLSFGIWLADGHNEQEYSTKLDIARKLITEYKDKIGFNGILLDGLYASSEMMEFFERYNIIYYMRFPRSRKVKENPHSIAFKLADNLAFRLKRNERSKTFVAYFGETIRYITAEKRLKRSGDYEIVYIISNEKVDSKETIFIYTIRWAIEKFFRTAKQTLGIADSSLRSITKQTLHIFVCFASYGIIDSIKFYKQLSCPEDASRYLKIIKDDLVFFNLPRSVQYFCN